MKLTLCTKPIYQIQNGRVVRQSLSVEGDLWQWLEKQADNFQMTCLLGHALDGVVWGCMVDKKLHLALCDNGVLVKEYDRTELADVLRELRLFGETAELYLWQSGGQWQASLIRDGDGDACEYIDDRQMLWGTQVEEGDDHFSLMSDGIQGLYHAVPLPESQIPVEPNGKHRPLRLQLRHYLADDEMGRVHITYSRLVAPIAVAKKEEESNGS
jgi:CRISPR-associated protein (TIGR03984 family)